MYLCLKDGDPGPGGGKGGADFWARNPGSSRLQLPCALLCLQHGVS